MLVMHELEVGVGPWGGAGFVDPGVVGFEVGFFLEDHSAGLAAVEAAVVEALAAEGADGG